MKKANSIIIGLLLIISAVLIILDSVGIGLGFLSGVPAISILIGALLIGWTLTEIIRLNISVIYFPLALLFMLFEKNISSFIGYGNENIINNWLVLLIACMLSIGTYLILPKRKKHKNISIGFEHGSDEMKTHPSSKGNNIVYIDCEDFTKEIINNDLGATTVYFSNIEQYKGDGVLYIENNLGSVKVNVPTAWKIESKIDNSLGTVTEPNDKGSGELKITIYVDNSLGSVQIVKV